MLQSADGVLRSGEETKFILRMSWGRGSSAPIPHGVSSFRLPTALLGSFADDGVRRYQLPEEIAPPGALGAPDWGRGKEPCTGVDKGRTGRLSLDPLPNPKHRAFRGAGDPVCCGHTYLLSSAASSTSSNCFICTPTSEVMFSALPWPCDTICRERWVSGAGAPQNWGGVEHGRGSMLGHGLHQR